MTKVNREQSQRVPVERGVVCRPPVFDVCPARTALNGSDRRANDRRPMWVFLLACSVAIAGLTRSAGTVSADQPRIKVMHVGVDNTAKVGYWTTVTVEVQNGSQPFSGYLEIRAPDGEGLPAFWTAVAGQGHEQRIDLAAGQRQVLTRYVRIGRLQGNVEAVLRSGNQVVERFALVLGHDVQMLESTRPWHVVVGGSLPLDRVWDKRLRSSGKLPAISYWRDIERVPPVARAFDGVDTLWLLTADREFLEKWRSEQWRALVEWVQSGGRLVLSLAGNAERWATGSGPLVPLVPAPPQQVVQVNEAPGLESFAHADQPLGRFTAVTCNRPDLPALAWFDARHAGRQPAICRYAVGLGVVTWVMFDLDQPAVESWSGTPVVLAELARQAGGEPPPAGREELTRRVVHIGFDEMVGQLRSALDFFPSAGRSGGVTLVSFTAVATLLVLYLLWLGPGDFVLLWLLRGRREWTWITWPLGIVAFCLLVHALHKSWRSPFGPLVNGVELLDIDADSGLVRGTLWASAYSPRLANYTWHIKPRVQMRDAEFEVAENLLTWQGLPGTGLGGLDRTAVETLSGVPYSIRVSEELRTARLVDAPILASGTRALLGQWRGRLSRPIGSGLWADRNGFLKGSFQNPLSVPLEGVLIAHERWAYRTDAVVPPGATVRIEQLQRRDLEWLLTERRILGTKVGYASTPWDQQSRNVDRIMEVMMFYTAAGGRNYTGLGHQYQSYVDMSDHLSLDRAIVVVRLHGFASELSAEQVTREPEHQGVTYYRFVMPVRRTEYPVGEATVQ